MPSPSFDYGHIEDVADRLLDRFGGPVWIRSFALGGEEWNPTRVATEFEAVAAVIDYQSRDIDGSLIRTGDRRALIKAGGLTIELVPGLEVTRGDETWRIERVNRIDPAGTGAIVYDVQLRAP